jgi:hypothetical protein
MSKNMTNMADQLKMAGVNTQNLNLTEKQAETAERLAKGMTKAQLSALLVGVGTEQIIKNDEAKATVKPDEELVMELKSLKQKVADLEDEKASLIEHKKRQSRTYEPPLNPNQTRFYFKADHDKTRAAGTKTVRINGTSTKDGSEVKEISMPDQRWSTSGQSSKHIKLDFYHNVTITSPEGKKIDGIAHIKCVKQLNLVFGKQYDKDTKTFTKQMWGSGYLQHDEDEQTKFKTLVSPMPNSAPELNHTVDEDGNQEPA